MEEHFRDRLGVTGGTLTNGIYSFTCNLSRLALVCSVRERYLDVSVYSVPSKDHYRESLPDMKGRENGKKSLTEAWSRTLLLCILPEE